jgi:hypothetical protein
MEEAIEWLRRSPFRKGNGRWRSAVFEAEDFAQPPPEVRHRKSACAAAAKN